MGGAGRPRLRRDRAADVHPRPLAAERYMIVDEAQNLTPHRGQDDRDARREGTKIILTGDPYRSITRTSTPRTNGLTTVAERFKLEQIAGHVILSKGEPLPLASSRPRSCDRARVDPRRPAPGRARARRQRQAGWESASPSASSSHRGANGSISISIAVDRGSRCPRMRGDRRSRGAGGDHAPQAPPRPRRCVDPEADAPRFAAAVRATRAVITRVKIRVRFWVCGGKACRRVDVRRAAVVAVAYLHHLHRCPMQR